MWNIREISGYAAANLTYPQNEHELCNEYLVGTIGRKRNEKGTIMTPHFQSENPAVAFEYWPASDNLQIRAKRLVHPR
jgi:hypothetical protein